MIRWVAWAAALAIGVAAPHGGATSSVPAIERSATVSVLSAAETSLEAQVAAWIAELAKDEAFSSWKDATWRKAPLGPGQHGWVIFVNGQGGSALGYLVVGAKPEGGYALLEYGAGEYSLFSSEVLDRALGSDGLEDVAFTSNASVERLYFDPMHAFWQVSEAGVTRYADAANGAWLPIAEEDVTRLKVATSSPESLSGKRLHIMKKPGDPYLDLDWLDTPDASIRGWGDFAAWLDGRGDGEAMYAGAAFGGAVMTPVGVAGYHWWPVADGSQAAGAASLRGYVAVDQEGLTRYAPLERLLAVGAFR
ncbi:hypothetical protein FE782_00920 [Paenibacillus antri]|uniref:Uncharacterized protein n=1 Tax=Paenibacillus antri TaxID=2582848 RepID=A0A5R9GP22_9BACL|nr:hypothetical protein [Paenibacillus antri]TLS53945.1 hypothetical protein FE782_00920 [Paenibacillus antri]